MQKNIPEEYIPWINLGGAIIREVVRDYKRALREGSKRGIERLERWFRSKDFTILSAGLIDPEFIIEQAKENSRVAYGNTSF